MKANLDRIYELEQNIRYHADLYYNQSRPEITDAEYDALVDELRNLDPDNVVLTEVGSTPSYGRKVTHSSVMGSLDKEMDSSGVAIWFGRYANHPGHKISVTPKIDGCSLRINYKDGKMIEAASRGNGTVGQDVTDNVRAITSIPKHIQGFTGEIRGEIYMKRSAFEQLRESGEKSMANPRNAGSGSLMAKDPAVTARRNLSLLVYDVKVDGTFKSESEKRAWMTINLPGIDLVEMQTISISEFKSVALSWEVRRPTLDYEIDGLVIALDSIEEQEEAGWNGHNPRGKIKFKFKPEQKTARVIGIDWQVGRTGRMTPMCRIDPTLVAGSTISNITLHNMSQMQEMRVAVGDEVLIEKAGDIIPQVVRVTQKGPHKTTPLPTTCPSCGGDTIADKVNLWCQNPMCPAQLERRVLHYIKTLEVMGVGSGIVSGLCKGGYVKDIPDLYVMTVEQIKAVTGGETAALNVLNAILSKNEVPLAMFLDSLGIDGLGTSTSKDVAKTFKTLLAVMGLPNRPGAAVELTSIQGIGITTANKIVEGLRAMGSMVDKIAKIIDIADVQEAKGNLGGKSFCLTGAMSKPRKDIEKAIEAAGGEVRSSVGKGLTYLVQADASSTSSKSEKAKKLGTLILGEAELWSMMQ
jgi:DNA ligase (NAD+)